MKTCPYCAEEIQDNAIVCRYCKRELIDLLQIQPASQVKDHATRANLSVALGIVALFAWLLPICGLPLALLSLGLGISGLQSSVRGRAIAGIMLSTIGLVLASANALLGILVNMPS